MSSTYKNSRKLANVQKNYDSDIDPVGSSVLVQSNTFIGIYLRSQVRFTGPLVLWLFLKHVHVLHDISTLVQISTSNV